MRAPTRAFEAAPWMAITMAACVAASVLFAIPLKVFGLQAPEPVFGLVPAFVWASARPSIVAPLALLLLGLFQDLLWGTFFGFWPLCLLAGYMFVYLIRRFLSGQEFVVRWAWFGAGCSVAFIVAEGASILVDGTAPSLLGVAAQWLVSAALYPLANGLTERYDNASARFR